MAKCPLCGEYTNKPSTRLIKESCGHSKCRFCLINEESGCSICEGNNGVSGRLESIGNFDYHLPATTIPNYEELHSTPRKLDFNKIPDDFIDCPLDGGKLMINNSINQSSDNVVANIPGPEKVDVSTETENIVPDRDVQSQTVSENTHSSLSQVTQVLEQPVAKVPEVFANTVSNNHQSHQETPVVQNTNFIPVTRGADGRQFITIAFIANNSPNKNQQVVTPLLNQCLPTLTNMTAVQRPGGNQCIPMLGNISALQNGNQFIIRSPNIVQNLVGNQSMPVIGNTNTMQNLPENQSLSIVGNLNAVKNLVANQSLPSLATLSPLQSPTNGQSLSITVSPNAVQKVVGNHPHQVTQEVSKEVEEQSVPVQENVNTVRRQARNRGLPRIKTVKNVNIAQKSATNQSDKVNSQIDKTPVQAVKRRRKELPVYLIPRKTSEQKKSPPVKSPPTQVISCMSPEYQLEDYLLFNKQQKAIEAKDLEIQTKTIYDTQTINKPSESVIKETPIDSDQLNGTVIQDKFIENKVDITEQEDKVPNDKTNDEKSTEDVSIETDECEERQDLSVIFNIREENKQTLNEKVEEEKEKIMIPNVEASNKDEYQNLDALFDIIEKESKKLNGGMFDKVEKSDVNEENGFDYEKTQKLHDKMDNGKDANNTLNQEDNVEGEKDQNLNNGIDQEHSKDQHLNLDIDSQNKKIENLNEEIGCNNEENRNAHEITYEQEQNLVEKLPIQNGSIELLAGETSYKEEKHHNLDTEMKDHVEESEILDNVTESPFENHEVVNEEEIQSSDEKIVDIEKKTENQVNEDASLQEEKDQHLHGGIMTEEVDSNENGVNDDKNNSQCTNEKIGNEETNNQILYEDISDEEKENGELSNENQELQTLNTENNDYENTIEAESQILNREAVDQHEETNQSLSIETHEEIVASASLDTNNDLPACDTNDLDNSKLDVTHQKEELVIVKKPRGRPKKSLHNYEEECKSEISNENDQSIAVKKDSQNLNTEVDGNGRDESFVLETHTDKDEIMHENVNTNLTLAETKKSEDEKPDTTTENAQSVIKHRRGRKKKSFSDYELDRKPESSKTNDQPVVKKPRGRPKKSLSNAEPLNQPNDSQGIEQSAALKLPSFCLGNSKDVDLDQSFEEEGQVLEVNAQIHNQETVNNSDGKSNSASVIKKPRGRPKIKNVLHDNERENLQSDVDAINTFVEENQPAVHNADTVNGNEHSTTIKKSKGRPKKSISTSEQPNQSDPSGENVEPTVVKKARGRPKKSLTRFEQHNESNVSKEIEISNTTEISNVLESINDEKSKEQHERDKESQVLDREDFNQDDASQDSRIDMNDEEKESLHPGNTTNLTSSDKSDLETKKSIIVNGSEPSIVVNKPRGKKKKSLSIFEQQIEPEVSDVNVEPTVVKKARGRPKKSLTKFEHHNESNVSQEIEISNTTEISNVLESINDEKSKEQHEGDEESQVLDREDFNQDDASQDSRVDMNDEEKESLHPGNTTNLTSSDKSDLETIKSIIVNGSEPSIVAKKPRGKKKKSLSIFEQQIEPEVSDVNVEPTVIKKARGRPKKSLPNVKQQNDCNMSQEPDISNVRETINEEESKEQHERNESAENQIPDKENVSQYEILRASSMDKDITEKEIPHSNDATNPTFSNMNESDIKNTVDLSSSIVIKKPKGRSKKSSTNSEQTSQPDVSDVSVEPTVKKSRGRPKKSFSIFEHNLSISQNIELSNTKEISNLCDKINDEDGQEEHETEENQDMNREYFETSQNSIVNMKDVEEKESLHSDVVASSIANESSDKAKNILNENEQTRVIKKPLGRLKKSLSSNEQQKDPVISDVDVHVKKSRGRPKKSNVPTNSDLNGENNHEKDQAQSFNRAIGKEGIKLPEVEGDSHDVAIQSLSTNLHKEDDESSILETEVNKSSNQNPVNDKLDITSQSVRITLVKKARGRPKKERPPEPTEKKQRGRPKKADYKQRNKSNLSPNEEHQAETKLPSFCTDYSDEKDEQQGLGDESRALISEGNDHEESSQMETPNEENKSSVDDCEKEKIDGREQGNDLIPNEDVSDKINAFAILSEDTDESQTQQQNCNEVSNNEAENHVLQKGVEEKDSQTLKVQDDENKENKKEYSEKDESKIENITPATEEQDLEKSMKEDGESPKNTTGRKYKKFDAMNAKVIVESSKRKRKPKVLLYENEDLDISLLKRKKKELNKSSPKSDSRIADKKSLEETQVYSLTPTNETKRDAESTEITVKKVNVTNQLEENEESASIDKIEHSQNVSQSNVNENPMDTETSENNVSPTVSSPKDEDAKSMKRNRRPKTLLYEDENLKIASKCIRKKKVEFLLYGDKDSIDSDNTEKDDRVTENNALEVFTNDDELTTKKKQRVRNSKTLLSFVPVKEKNIKSEIEKKEDLMMMKKFEIKLEPIIVLERIIDLSNIKKYDTGDNSWHILHESEGTIHQKLPKSTVDVKKPRGRPKLSNGPAALKKKNTSSKVLVSKHKKSMLNTEKRCRGRPNKEYNHIITLPGMPTTYQCSICSQSFKHYTNRTLHITCARRAQSSTIKYKCELCPKNFYHKTHWEYHVRSHKGDKPFRCDLCGKKFLQKGKLNRHLLIHKYTQDLECNECGKKFVSKEYLKSHLLSHVKSSFVFRCNQCPKSFKVDSNRKRHELSHSPVVALFKCPHCPKSFKSKFVMKRHAKIHQKLRPFTCDQCAQVFLTNFELKRHYIAHTGVKKYTCTYCQQPFGRIDNYNRHMLHHHPVETHEDFLSGNINGPTPEVSPETPSIEEKQQEKKKDKSAVKPKKISRTPSNPVSTPISFIQPLTPQSMSSPYSISQNHELASVIHETLPDLNNAVPVISAPICAQPSLSLIDPIPLEQALVLNRQIEEKIYTQSSFCEFPGLTRRVNVTVVNHSQSFDYSRRSSSESNSSSNDHTSFLTMNHEQIAEQQDDNETSPAKKDIHVHWRRRTAETFKSKID